MRVHFLGICGTFMAGLAVLANELGYKISGADQQFYPPMDGQLKSLNAELITGYDAEQLSSFEHDSDSEIVVGNVMRRGMPVVERMLDQKIDLVSGPEWLYKHVLRDKWVLAVSGTHGKTTTASMLAWILEYAGLKPGFLIGGVPENFNISARLGTGRYFVVEADEYDSAFFDKRSKFIHYRPQTLIINNLEYDHSDIFPNLDAIKRQFNHLLRLMPSEGLVVANGEDPAVEQVLDMGLWTPCTKFGLVRTPWQVSSQGIVTRDNQIIEQIDWQLCGQHNLLNGLAAIAAAQHIGVSPKVAIQALCHFSGVKRRTEIKGEVENAIIMDDFAHHPTAILQTIAGLKQRYTEHKLIVVVDISSNSMKAGTHQGQLGGSLAQADEIYLYSPQALTWSPQQILDSMPNKPGKFFGLDGREQLLDYLEDRIIIASETGKTIVIFMSNSGFAQTSGVLLQRLQIRAATEA